MATLAPMNPPTRQPFGAVSGTRLRNMGNVKNKQNALPSSQPSKLKTFSPQSQIFDDIDSENIDPSIFKSSKTSGYPSKNFTSTTDKMNCFKPAQFMLTRATAARTSASQLPPLTQAIGMKRKAESAPSASDIEPERLHKSARKLDLPAPAGRSPKSKRAGILSRHRVSASPFARVDPPSFGSNKTGHGLSFSIDAALAGTVPAHKLRKPAQKKDPASETVLDGMPKGWMFDIHTDSKDEEASNLMEHSTCTLDISDDETSKSKMFDEENKENVPPQPGMNAPITHAVAAMHASRKHMMTDEPRAPLGDLEASDYYAPGCDASSYITIPWDHDVKSNIQNEIVPEASTVYTSAKVDVEAVDKNLTWNDLIEMTKPDNKTTGLTPAMTATTTNTDAEQGSLLPIMEDNEDSSAFGSVL